MVKRISDRILELNSDIDGFTERDAQSLQAEFDLSHEQTKTVYEAVKNGYVGESDFKSLAKIMGREEAIALDRDALGLARNEWFRSRCWIGGAPSHLGPGVIIYLNHPEMDCPHSILMNGVTIPGGTKIGIWAGILDSIKAGQEMTLAGIPVMAGKEIRYYQPWMATFEPPARSRAMARQELDAMDFVVGKVKFFTAAREFEKYGLQFNGDTEVTLYPDGRLKSGQAGPGQSWGSVKWLESAKLVFSNHGKMISLESGSYIFYHETRGKPYHASGSVSFFENGVPQEIILSREEKILGRVYPANTRVSFTPKGTVDAIHLTRPWTVHNQSIPADSTFYFNDAGNIDRILWGEDFAVRGIYFPSQSHLEFKGGGNIWKIVAEVVGPFKCPLFSEDKGSVTARAEFFPDGKLKTALLGTSQEIEGKTYPAGSELHFYRNGKLSRAFLPEYHPFMRGDWPTTSCPNNKLEGPDF